MDYNFNEIEKKWQQFWKENKTYQVEIDKNKPKYYVLDMFPYPSGAGLHVGHPLGYIASDIYARYKRLKGFNVLHPMGYDAYGLPAEQYAIQTGQHPAITTEQNIARYREQLDKIGFSFDWEREIRTCDPEYYKWTQWAFVKMFNSVFCNICKKALPMENIIEAFEESGTEGLDLACTEPMTFTADDWKAKSEKEKQKILMNYRLAYLADTMVNWCSALGTVLANDEVSEGVSVRGGHPVEQRKMRQWSLRVSAYSQRLLDGLDKLEWTESLKETQRNWIGRSEGAELNFNVVGAGRALPLQFTVFTTRADTIFGVTFMVLAPESEYVSQVVTAEQKEEVAAYLDAVKRRTERERIADRRVTGVFTGSYAINPVNGEAIPIWISDYVLAGYGTGAIMAVPAHDSRDYAFAKHFNLPIIPLIEGADVSEESFDAKEGIMINSGFLNGLTVKEAIQKAKEYIAENHLGKVKVNYRLRDAIFSRQRYWGEPFPIYYKEGMPYTVAIKDLPIELPEVDKFLPTETGEPPLGRAKDWVYREKKKRKSAIHERLEDLQNQAVHKIKAPNCANDILIQYIKKGATTLDDINNAKDFFLAIAFLNAQSKSSKIEDFIRKKLGHSSVNAKKGRGDGEKNGKYYEYKISTTNKEEQINALQIRLNQEVNYYLLGYIDEKDLTQSRLYFLSKNEMQRMCDEHGKNTHGTKSVNATNSIKEKTLRIKMKTDNDLLKYFEEHYRATDLEITIFNDWR